jgi:hypothetical protein
MKYNKTFREALNEVRKIKEDGHTDVASAVRQSKTSIEDASQMLMKLQRMNPEDALPSWWMNKLAIAANNLNKLRDYLLVPSITNENLEEQDNPFKPDKVYSQDDVSKLEAQIDKLKTQLEKEKAKADNAIPNRDTGEIPLQTGIAHAILKIKDKKLEQEVKKKQSSNAIKKLAKESMIGKSLGMIGESQASDKAKAMGLDYMSFGRYGKDGKVTHKSIGGQLTAVDKDEKPIDTPKGTGADQKKGAASSAGDGDELKVKSKKFLQDFEDGTLEDDDGPIELDFDDEQSFEAAAEKARSMGLDDLADDIDSVGGYVMEMEPDNAQAEYQDILAKYSNQPVKAVELSKKADQAIDLFTDNKYSTNDVGNMTKDLKNVASIVKKMVDSDITVGDAGSGMTNAKKGFRPEVISTLKSLEDITQSIGDVKDDIENEKVKETLGEIQGILDFITDENADHDGYTKPHKVNGALAELEDLLSDMSKMKKESYDGFARLERFKRKYLYEKEEEIITDDDLIKDPSLEDVIKQDMKKKKKLDKKKSEIKVNPEMDIGVFSGGRKVPNGNLH